MPSRAARLGQPTPAPLQEPQESEEARVGLGHEAQILTSVLPLGAAWPGQGSALRPQPPLGEEGRRRHLRASGWVPVVLEVAHAAAHRGAASAKKGLVARPSSSMPVEDSDAHGALIRVPPGW